jgi:hypothetical protein
MPFYSKNNSERRYLLCNRLYFGWKKVVFSLAPLWEKQEFFSSIRGTLFGENSILSSSVLMQLSLKKSRKNTTKMLCENGPGEQENHYHEFY